MMLGIGEQWPLSHVSLVWMVNEAKKAGLRFDTNKEQQSQVSNALHEMDLLSGDYKNVESESDGAEMSGSRRDFVHSLHSASEKGLLHDELKFGNGWSPVHVCKRKARNLFFSKILSKSVASKHNHREIPLDANIHSSVLRRMRVNPTYRPSNLRISNPDSLTIFNKGDLGRECFVRRA